MTESSRARREETMRQHILAIEFTAMVSSIGDLSLQGHYDDLSICGRWAAGHARPSLR